MTPATPDRASAAPPVAVIGAGAWGTALAQLIASDGTPVLLWAREAAVVDAVNTTQENALFLPGIRLADAIVATADLTRIAACPLILMVVPAQFARGVLAGMPRLSGDSTVILCAKGMEAGSHAFPLDMLADTHPDARPAVLSGPTFAAEVARGLPTAVTLAAPTMDEAAGLADRIARPTFRPYAATDMIGAEIGGAVKNVLAIACGIVDGAGLGQNARAALISRGFAEMTRFGLARGARAETLAGLAGLGDLVLTCSSTASRNYALGRGLGQGGSPAGLVGNRRTVAEGAASAPVILEAAMAAGVDMPITAAVAAILAGDVAVDAAIHALLARPLRGEAR